MTVMIHAITLLAQLPYHNDTRDWARLTPDEQRTLDNARDVVALGGRLHADEYDTLVAAYRRLHGHNVHGGPDEVTS